MAWGSEAITSTSVDKKTTAPYNICVMSWYITI